MAPLAPLATPMLATMKKITQHVNKYSKQLYLNIEFCRQCSDFQKKKQVSIRIVSCFQTQDIGLLKLRWELIDRQCDFVLKVINLFLDK